MEDAWFSFTSTCEIPMLITAYLWLNAFLYLLFSLWCAFAPEKTSSFLGLSRKDDAGITEYLAVYGGLQFGLAIIFAWSVLGGWQMNGLRMAIALYAGIVAFRTIGAFQVGFGNLGNAAYSYGLELTLLIMAVALWTLAHNRP